MLMISALPSTCPDKRWPPIGSPKFKDPSRFTVSFTLSSPKVVLARVSLMTSKVRVKFWLLVMVRQTPSTAMLWPILVENFSWNSGDILTCSLANCLSRVKFKTSKCPKTMPENI